MSQPSFTKFIVARPWLYRIMKPMADWYCQAAGYRQLGLKYASPSHIHLYTYVSFRYHTSTTNPLVLIFKGDGLDD